MARNFVAASTQYLTKAAAIVTAPPVTFSCWFKPSSLATNQLLMAVGNSASDNYVLMAFRGDLSKQLQCQAFDGTSNPTADTAKAILQTGSWYHCVGTFATGGGVGQAKVYLNAGAPAFSASPAYTTISWNKTNVGAYTNGNSIPANGAIAHAAIWDILLSDFEIMLLASGVLPSQIRRKNLKLYVLGDIGPQSSEFDQSGLGNTMTLTNAPVPTNGPRMRLITLPRQSLFALGAPAGDMTPYNPWPQMAPLLGQ